MLHSTEDPRFKAHRATDAPGADVHWQEAADWPDPVLDPGAEARLPLAAGVGRFDPLVMGHQVSRASVRPSRWLGWCW